MFKNSKVSLGGRLILTAIFALTVFGPEIVIMINLSQLGVGIGMSFVRIGLGFFLYYFAMMGHGWARWITAFLLIITGSMIVAICGHKLPLVAIGAAILFIPGIAILVGLKSVQADPRMRSRRRHRSHGT